MDAPLSPVCAPEVAQRLEKPADLVNEELLRSYRMDEWALWFRAAGLQPPGLRGWMFDSSLTLVDAAAQGVGVALAPVAMFARPLAERRIVQPFRITVLTGGYWLTRLKSRSETPAMVAFRDWLLGQDAPSTAASRRLTGLHASP
jgi:LysR family transcriptional regulator of beta-lactamase